MGRTKEAFTTNLLGRAVKVDCPKYTGPGRIVSVFITEGSPGYTIEKPDGTLGNFAAWAFAVDKPVEAPLDMTTMSLLELRRRLLVSIDQIDERLRTEGDQLRENERKAASSTNAH